MRKTAAIIVNPISGRGIALKKAHAVLQTLKQAGIEISFNCTQAAGQAREFARRLADMADVFVSVGGDGTLNEVINGVVDSGSNTPIAIIPTGTANVVFRELELPEDLCSQAKLALESDTRSLDVGIGIDRCFIMCAGIGFDAAVVNAISRTRKTRGFSFLSYVPVVLREALHYPFPMMNVSVDGKIVDKSATFTVIGNLPRYGGFFHIFDSASPHDGVLDICCMHGNNTKDLFRYGWGAYRKNLSDFPDVSYYRGKDISIEAEEKIWVQVDGDPWGELPVRFNVRPSAVTFCV